MKYLRRFNESKFNLKEFLKSSINWNLFNYLQDVSTEFADYGLSVEVTVRIQEEPVGEIYLYSSCINIENAVNGWQLSGMGTESMILDVIRSSDNLLLVYSIALGDVSEENVSREVKISRKDKYTHLQSAVPDKFKVEIHDEYYPRCLEFSHKIECPKL